MHFNLDTVTLKSEFIRGRRLLEGDTYFDLSVKRYVGLSGY